MASLVPQDSTSVIPHSHILLGLPLTFKSVFVWKKQ